MTAIQLKENLYSLNTKNNMHRNHELQADAARDYAREQQRKIKERNEKGLCHRCGEVPANPALPTNLCVDCHEKEPQGCEKSGCTNSVAGSYRQARLCEVHLINIIHSEYQEYEQRKSKLEELKQEFYDLVDDVGFDPREQSKRPSEMTDRENTVLDLHTKVKAEERNLDLRKKQLQKAISQVEQAFPDNFSTSV